MSHLNRQTTRLPYWDYRNSGAYFVTICTKNKEHYFGEIANGCMQYSPIGAIADVLWSEIKNRHDNIELGEFVIMPNHMHGIVMLDNDDNLYDDNLEILHNLNVRTGHALSVLGENRFQNIGKNSLSSIIGGYKSAVSKHANRLNLPFAWQARFHEHIIRDEQSFLQISDYVIHNPAKWELDRFFS